MPYFAHILTTTNDCIKTRNAVEIFAGKGKRNKMPRVKYKRHTYDVNRRFILGSPELIEHLSVVLDVKKAAKAEKIKTAYITGHVEKVTAEITEAECGKNPKDLRDRIIKSASMNLRYFIEINTVFQKERRLELLELFGFNEIPLTEPLTTLQAA